LAGEWLCGTRGGQPRNVLSRTPLIEIRMRVANDGIAFLSGSSYRLAMSTMKGITIKLPETTLRRLRQEARASGRSVAALIRERVEVPLERDDRSVYAMTSDLAGSVAGGRKAATNARRKFVRA
jgi:predicted DNA-binding protein